MSWNREEIAARAAQDIPDGSYVNLGIGIPELIAQFVPEGRVTRRTDCSAWALPRAKKTVIST
jgi:acyl CoA:acetate/3-ketoacid CoA transferase beta subunit